jgi:hypothetical protein
LCTAGGGAAADAGATGKAATGTAATGKAVTGAAATGAAAGTAGAGALCAVAVSGGGGGIDETFVSSAVVLAVLTTEGTEGFSGLPDRAQTPIPTTTTAAAPRPIQSPFFPGCLNDVEDSTSIAGVRALDGGTVDVVADDGALDCILGCGWYPGGGTQGDGAGGRVETGRSATTGGGGGADGWFVSGEGAACGALLAAFAASTNMDGAAAASGKTSGGGAACWAPFRACAAVARMSALGPLP